MADEEDEEEDNKERIDELVRRYQLKSKRAYVPPPMVNAAAPAGGGVDVSRVHRDHGLSAGSDGALPDRLFTLGRGTLARHQLLKAAGVRAVLVRHAYKLHDQVLDLLVCRRPPSRPGALAAEANPELLAFAKRLRSCPSAAAAAAATAAALADEDNAEARLRLELIRDVDAQLRKLATLLLPPAAGAADAGRPSGRLPHTSLERACMPFAITYEDSGVGPLLFRHKQPRSRKLAKVEH